MKRLVVVALIVLVPLASAVHAAPQNVRVDAKNQVLDVSWDPVPGTDVAGYTVRVYAGSDLVQAIEVTTTSATFRGVNGRAYAVTVAARDPGGVEGPASTPVAAVPSLERDQTYLALGLIVIWAGIWMYAFLLARTERDVRNRIERLRSERQRLGDRR